MAQPKIRPWQPQSGNRLEKFEDNLWCVSGPVPGSPGLPRRMAMVKRSDGKILFYNAIPVDDATLAEIRAWGEPAFLIVPHAFHMIDGPAFQEKLGVRLYCPANQKDAVTKRGARVDGVLEDLPTEPSCTVEPSAGVKSGDPILLVRSGERVTLFIDDTFSNVAEGPFMMRLMGFAGGPKVPRLVRWFFVKDKARLRAQLERVAAMPQLARIIPCHGDPIERAPGEALRNAAAVL
jgi:hypothetical protein